jgi:hypothetical protein
LLFVYEIDELVSRLHIDGIPHFAFLNAAGEIEGALVGAVPEKILDDQISALVKTQSLPYSSSELIAEVTADGTLKKLTLPVDATAAACSTTPSTNTISPTS